MDVLTWIQKHDPDTIPYRPGVPRTGDRFGLRADSIGSPIHLGDDRGRHPRHIVMPFDGILAWSKTGGAWGSTARLIPDDNTDVEIQIAHTVRRDNGHDDIDQHFKRGDTLPIIAGDIGLSTGIHTHTEFAIRYTDSDYMMLSEYSPLRAGWIDGEIFVNDSWIADHCREHDIEDPDDFHDLVEKQVYDWGILELRDGVCIRSRDRFPARRNPWGTDVILADPMRWLKI